MSERTLYNPIARVVNERSVDSPPIYSFLETKYRGENTKRINGIINDVVGPAGTPPTMPDKTRVVINIPANYKEMGLGNTLNQYVKQTAWARVENGKRLGPPFEVVVVVNNGNEELSGNPKQTIKEGTAYTDALQFMREHPDFPLVLSTVHYPKEKKFTIGEARRDLAAFSLYRALDTEGDVDVNNLVVVTNDADLQKLPKTYISQVAKEFECDPKLSGLAGFVDYPEMDFDADHVFFIYQRFNDAYEIVHRKRRDDMSMKGGNSAFRMLPYVRNNGHTNLRTGENRRLYKELKKEDPNSVRYHKRNFSLTTSARRQQIARVQEIPLVERHAGFTKPGDLSEEYFTDPDTFRIPEKSVKITNPEFKNEIESQMDTMYRKIVSVDPNSVNTIQHDMVKAAAHLGIDITFVRMTRERQADLNTTQEMQLVITNTARLKKYMQQNGYIRF